MTMDKEKWSKDWENYDWTRINKNADKLESLSEDEAKELIDFTKQDMEEYCDWLMIHNPEYFEKVMIYMKLRENNFPDEHAAYMAEHPELLLDILKMLGKA